MSSEGKKKKEKVEYVDDGRSLADMSEVGGGFGDLFRDDTPSYSTFADKWKTFWMAFRLMLLPTAVVCAGLAVLYLIMYLLFKFAL